MDYNDDSDYNEFPSSSPIIKIDSKSINITPISENGIDDDNNHDIKTDENDPGKFFYYIIDKYIF